METEKGENIKKLTDAEKVELNNLAKVYLEAKKIAEEKNSEAESIKKKIMAIMDTCLSVTTENYLFKSTPTVRDTLQKAMVAKKFKELKLELDSSYFKHTEYLTLKVEDLVLIESKKQKNEASEADLNSEHRVKVSFDDLQI